MKIEEKLPRSFVPLTIVIENIEDFKALRAIIGHYAITNYGQIVEQSHATKICRQLSSEMRKYYEEGEAL